MRSDEFFHGTTHDVAPPPGSNTERIVPFSSASQIHADQGHEYAGWAKYEDLYNAEPWRMHHVFSSNSEKDAWSWASGHGRARVYHVEPEGEPEHEAYSTWDAGEHEKISRTARVLGVQFTPPHTVAAHLKSANWQHLGGGAVQGTLIGQDYRGGWVGHDWSPYHDVKAAARAQVATGADQAAERAAGTVRRQMALNNRRAQRKLF